MSRCYIHSSDTGWTKKLTNKMRRGRVWGASDIQSVSNLQVQDVLQAVRVFRDTWETYIYKSVTGFGSGRSQTPDDLVENVLGV